MDYRMRRAKQQLSAREVLDLLGTATSGTLSLAPQSQDDYPYAVPLSFALVSTTDTGAEAKPSDTPNALNAPDAIASGYALYFHSAKAGRKVDALSHNARASFCVIGQDEVVAPLYATNYRSAIVFGTVDLVQDEDERLAAFRALAEKYAPSETKKAHAQEIEEAGGRAIIYKMSIDEATGKRASDQVCKRADDLRVSPAVHKSMQGNKRANTKPELLVRERLRAAGLGGYRLQWKVPGRPDIAWPGKKVALFVNGCFWHRCPHCKPSAPKKNIEYWMVKFEKNQQRDAQSIAQLEQMGWKVYTIWECQLKKKKIDETMAELIPKLAADLEK